MMLAWELAERAYFAICLTLGRLLRSARYSNVRIVHRSGESEVRKRRLFYAPLLIWMGAPLVRILDAGVRVLPQRNWEDRERQLSRRLRGTSIRVDEGNVLVLPFLAGRTLATWLDDPSLERPSRSVAIEHAVASLADFHRLGFTHGDAMAENVVVDLDADVAHWFDFETVHDPGRSPAWRRADDVRALLMTCLARSTSENDAETIDLILRVYADEDVANVLATSFTRVWRRSLTFHLAQAPLSFQRCRNISRLLRERQLESGEGSLREAIGPAAAGECRRAGTACRHGARRASGPSR